MAPNKFEIFEDGPGGRNRMAGLLRDLPDAIARLHEVTIDVPHAFKNGGIVLRGHHIQHPLMTLVGDFPSVRRVLTYAGARESDRHLVDKIVREAAVNFAVGIITSDKPPVYISDVLGGTSQSLYDSIRNISGVLLGVLTASGDIPVRLVIESVDDPICQSCHAGEHCLIPESNEKILSNADAIRRLIRFIPEYETGVIMGYFSSPRQLSYVSEATVPLGGLRVGLVRMYEVYDDRV